ncbi:MAG: SDR family NAD(P)-dependent oxidoreductase, partial [Candidatus Dormibacteraeota bacterium]|nr:SDR family NAD(P)-dependent oxidoreductase [Candidatus Dormibacteraeota bacterium]
MTAGRLEGRVAVVTGAAGGIGGAICARLRAEGAVVVATDLRLGPDVRA